MTGADSVVAPLGGAARPLRARLAATLIGYGLLATVACLLAPLVGSTSISLS